MSLEVLLVGDPRLRERARPVGDPTAAAFIPHRERLHAALQTFRRRHGFGRAIAAPQLGIPLRFVAVDLGPDGERPFTLVDPEITHTSDATVTLWDDCMSFRELLVRVRRHASIALTYTDESGNRRELADLDPARAELFQHELDHLDGILALDRALDRHAIVHRQVFEADPERFLSRVDLPPRIRTSTPLPGAGVAPV